MPNDAAWVRPRLSRSFVLEFRQRRITDALAACCAQKGYAATTVTDIVKGAGISRQTLYDEFPNKGAVAVALLERAHGELFASVEAACQGEPGMGGVEAGLAAVLAWIERDPTVARGCIVERFGFPQAAELQAEVFDRFVAMLAARVPQDEARPSFVEEMVVGGAESMLRYRLAAGGGTDVSSLLPSLLAFVCQPFEGDWPGGGDPPGGTGTT